MLSGRVAYKDVLDMKPPLTAVLYAISLFLFGHSMTAIRILDLLWTCATALVLFAFGRRAFKSQGLATIAGCLYPFVYFPLGYWYTAQTDGWLNLPVAVALALFLAAVERKDRTPSLLWLMSGLCCGIALLFKYTVWALPVLILLFLLVGYRSDLHRMASAIGLLLLGTMVPLVACAFALLLSGAMPAFIDSQFGLVPAYAAIGGNAGLQTRIESFLATFTLKLSLPAVMLVAGALAGAGSYVRRPDRRLGLLLLAAWLVAAFVSTFSQGKFFVYHFLPLLPVSALAGGLLADLVLAKLGRARLPAAVALAVGLFLVAQFPQRFKHPLCVLSDRESARSYWVSDLHNMGADFSLRDDIELADYLRQTTLPTDRVFIWGFEPGVNFLAQRSTVSRFIYNLPMIIGYAPQRYRAEFMQTFFRDPAEVLVVEHNDAMPWATGTNKDSYAVLLEYPELLEFVKAEYRADTSIERFDILRLNPVTHK